MLELLTPAQMAEADRLTIAGGISGIELMKRAGRAIADAVMAEAGAETPICVIAGPGNNGGDGFVAARCLMEKGYSVRLVLHGDRQALRGDAAQAAERWDGPVEPASPAGFTGVGVVVDALFGAGLNRIVDDETAAMIAALNASAARIVAVDLPSGINGETGAIMGAAVRADVTVTFFRRKPGHLLMPGRTHRGQLIIADIGIPASVLTTIRPSTFANEPALWRDHYPVPTPEGHKYSRGHAVVLSGDLPSTGAARLAARGALRAGAGLVTLATPSAALAVNAAASLAVMVRQVDDPAQFSAMLRDARIKALVLGPGGGAGERMRRMVEVAFSGEASVVLDADALTSFSDDPNELFSHIKTKGKQAIFTPHQGEFKKLFKELPQGIDRKLKLEAAIAASRLSGAVIVLKGPDTVIASPDGRAAIAANAPLWLATAGSGDVLAGICGALLAQGMPAFEAACAAVWMHGEAGQEAGPGLIAEDLPEALRPVIRRLVLG